MKEMKLFLNHILESVSSIEIFIKDLDLEAFKKNDLVRSAVVQKFQVIGEASNKLPEEFRKAHPEIPWGKMIGMRNILSHFYFGIKWDLVWITAKERITEIKTGIENILKALQ